MRSDPIFSSQPDLSLVSFQAQRATSVGSRCAVHACSWMMSESSFTISWKFDFSPSWYSTWSSLMRRSLSSRAIPQAWINFLGRKGMNLGHYNSPVFYQRKQLNRQANLIISHPLFSSVWGKTFQGYPWHSEWRGTADRYCLSAGAPLSLDPQ